MQTTDRIRAALADIDATFSSQNTVIRQQDEELARLRGNKLHGGVKPFAHPLGKIETIKMVRVLDQSSLLDAKNKVDGWERDGLADFRLPSLKPVEKRVEWRGYSDYNVGDTVMHYGVEYKCVKDVRNATLPCVGPTACNTEKGAPNHWAKVAAPVSEWSGTKEYLPGDKVTRNRKEYVATKYVSASEVCYGPGDNYCMHFRLA